MNDEISVAELKNLPRDSYVLIDIRDEYSFRYGHIDGAINIPQKSVEDNIQHLQKSRKIIVCCKSGIISRETAEDLCEKGFEACNLSGGYCEWLRVKLENASVSKYSSAELKHLTKTCHKKK